MRERGISGPPTTILGSRYLTQPTYFKKALSYG